MQDRAATVIAIATIAFVLGLSALAVFG